MPDTQKYLINEAHWDHQKNNKVQRIKMLQISLFLMTIIYLMGDVTCQSSLSPLYYPATGIGSYRSSIFSSASSTTTMNHYTLIFDSNVSFGSIPHFFVGIYDLQWSGNLDFGVFLGLVTKTNANIAVRISTSVTVLKLSFIALDSALYGLSKNDYSVGPLLLPTSFTITNHQQYQITLLSQYIGSGSASNQPILTIIDYISKQSTKISMQIKMGYQIMLMRMSMFKILTAAPPVSGTVYGVVIVVASNTNSTIWFNADYYESLYPNQYFIGLQVLFSLKTPGIQTFSITSRTKSSMDAYMSQMMNLIQYCPALYPYFNLSSHLCYSSCGSGQYHDPYQVCRFCDSICQECLGHSYNCTSCPLSIYSLVPNTTTSDTNIFTCSCQVGAYQQTNPVKICKSCNQSMLFCQACSNSSVCEICPESLTFNQISKQCECIFGILKIVNGQPRCISTTIRQQCATSGFVFLPNLSPLACSCPDLYLQLLGVCIPI